MKFLLNTLTNWNEPPRTRHQIAYALAKNHEVIYISSNKTSAFPGISIARINDNLTVITPRFPIDCRIRYRIPLINEIYQIWLFRKLKRNYKDYNVVNFDFTGYLIHRFFKSVTYYCNDNFTSISEKINSWPVYRYHKFCEKELVQKASLCIGTSRIITDNLLKTNRNSYEIPLGGPDIDEFNIKPDPKRNNPGLLNIGLVGFITTYNLSVQLLNDLLSKIDCQITLIGPLNDEFYNLIADKTRVILKGVLTGKELLNEVNSFDVAIAPYLDRKIEEGGLPNKLMIYLALGKPVVLSDLQSLKELSLEEGLIYPVKNNEDFPAMILKAQAENSERLIQMRSSYARENTWEKRVENFIKILGNS
jgi:hypothetical protein